MIICIICRIVGCTFDSFECGWFVLVCEYRMVVFLEKYRIHIIRVNFLGSVVGSKIIRFWMFQM